MKERIGRGFWLAVAVAAVLTARGRLDWLGAYGLKDGFFISAAVMMIPGAFLASVPERIRRRKEPKAKSSWKTCLGCFACGLVMMLGAGLAGGADGMMLSGLCQGSVSAYAFAGVSAVGALAAGRLMERRKGA